MKEKININFPLERMEKNKKRLEAWKNWEYVDRVPVVLGVEARVPLYRRGVGFKDYFTSPERQFINQIHNSKWIIENIADDRLTEPVITVKPDFQNVLFAGGFGAKIGWFDDSPPRCIPIIENPEDVEKIKVPSHNDHLWGTYYQWYKRMQELAEDVEITFNGVPGKIQVTMGPGVSNLFSTAVELAGDNFFLWLATNPKECHQLLEKIMLGIINFEKFRRSESPEIFYHLAGEDAAQLISRDMFKEFALPYLQHIYEEFPGERQIHMCGRSDHLHDLLINELKVSYFNGLGRDVPPEVAAKTLGGKVRISGNVDPMVVEFGTEEEIRAKIRHALETFAPLGGYMLQDGYNITPGTPLRNINFFIEEAEKYGLPKISNLPA